MFDKNVPVPPVITSQGRRPLFAFADMDVGDSLPVPKKKYRSAVNAIQYLHRAKNGKRFTIRTFEGAFRVWRIS